MPYMQDGKSQKKYWWKYLEPKQAFQKIKIFHGQIFFLEILIKNIFFVNVNNSFFELRLYESKHKVAK